MENAAAKMKIEFVDPELYMSNNIAIVGSSGSVTDNKHGDLIDSFEDIVRFNTAITEGYEMYVGSRTTLRIVNNVVLGCHYNGDKFVTRLRNSRLLYYGPDRGLWKNKNKYLHKSVEAFEFDYKKMSGCRSIVEMGSDKKLRIGFGFIVLCVISGVKPHLFGFDIRDRERDHYWEEAPELGGHHNHKEEKDTVKRLIEDEKIIFHE